MIKPFVWPYDDDTPIEALPGYLGYCVDILELWAGDELQPLVDFDWHEYAGLLKAAGGQRTLVVSTLAGALELELGEYPTPVDLLDQYPAIDVMYDEATAYLGPCSCSYLVFVLAEGADYQQVAPDMKALREALDRHVATLRQEVVT